VGVGRNIPAPVEACLRFVLSPYSSFLLAQIGDLDLFDACLKRECGQIRQKKRRKVEYF